jgi:hypothetical protein
MALLKYPRATIEAKTDYFRLDLIKFENSRGTRSEGNLLRNSTVSGGSPAFAVQNIDSSIFLPMPSNIQDGNSVSYADDSLNGYAAAAVSGVTDIITGNNGQKSGITNTLGSIGDKFTKTLDTFITDPAARQAMNRYFAASAVNIFGANVTPDQLLARETGQIFNPNMELLFNGVTLRSFKFSFKLTPRNKDEAKDISDILRKLKEWMAPQAGDNNRFLKSPNVFQPYFMKGSGIHPFLNLIKMSALTDMSVNYTGENVYATYSDGSPVSYILDLTFKELEPIYSSDYKSTPNNIGF